MIPSSFTTALQDPAAVIELLAAALTACYLLRLTFVNERARVELPPSLRTVPFRASSIQAREKLFSSKLLRLFAVGEAITIKKKSLRRQRGAVILRSWLL